MNHREEVDGQLLEPGRDTPALLEPAGALFDGATAAVGAAIELMSAIVGPLVLAARDDHSNGMAMQPVPDATVAIALVARHRGRALPRRPARLSDRHAVHDRVDLRRLVDLARRDVRGEGNAATVSDQVELAPESAARATQRVVGGFSGAPFFPAPAAAREARIELPSMPPRSQST